METRILSSLKNQINWMLSGLVIFSQLVLPLSYSATAYAAANDITASDHEGQLSPAGTWSNGNITQYSELEDINFRYTLNSDGIASGQMEVRFTGVVSTGQTCTFFQQQFALGSVDPVSGATPLVSLFGTPFQDGNEWVQVLDVDFAAAGEAIVNYTLTLSDNAGDCGGSSQHSTLDNSDSTGDFANIGNQNVPVPASDILQLADIVAIKQFDDDRDGLVDRTATANEWEFSLDGVSSQLTDGAGSVTWSGIGGGDHVISEDLSGTGYSFLSGSGAGCDFNSTDATSSLDIVLTTNDQTITCTFLNQADLIPATLTLQKQVVNGNGGLASASDFVPLVNGVDTIEGQSVEWMVPLELSAGTYDLSEVMNVEGYEQTNLQCIDQNQLQLVVPLDLQEGDEVVCTFTNDDISPRVSVVKQIINDNGGLADADDFDYYVNAQQVDESVWTDIDANTEYAISEVMNVGGYVQDSIVCLDVTNSNSPFEIEHPFTSDLARDYQCTITNNDQPATVRIVKYATNDDGGTVTADQFDVMLDGVSLDVDFNGTPVGNVTSALFETVEVEANTPHTVSEPLVEGYENTYISCFSITNNDVQIDHPFTALPGEEIVCNVGNNDIPPKLTVVKEVNNSWNGNLDVEDFPLYVDGNLVVSGQQVELDAGTVVISEDQMDGYSFGGFSGDCNLGGEINLVVGGVYTCTLTNNDLPAQIIVTKDITNDDGGTADVSDFELYVNSTEVEHGVTNTFAGNTEYNISEVMNVDGYEQISIDCADVTDTNNIVVLDSTFTAENGHSYACEISNDDIAPTLRLVKSVINDNGGDNLANEWVLKAVGSVTYIDDAGVAVSDSMAATEYIDVMAADPITLSESGPDGYSASEWICDGGQWVNNELYLSLAENVSCEITNNDIAVDIEIVKIARNDDGGSVLAEDFDLYLNGSLLTNMVRSGERNETISYAVYLVENVSSNSVYEITEDGVEGYEHLRTVCRVVDGNGQVVGHPFTPSEGQTIRCRVVNDDLPGELTLVKTVINDNGGQATQDMWTLSAEGEYSEINGVDNTVESDSGVTDYVQSGWYELSEIANNQSIEEDDYSLESIECNQQIVNLDSPYVYVGNGQTVTCVFTNNDVAPNLRIYKYAQTANQPIVTEFEFNVVQNDHVFGSPYSIDANLNTFEDNYFVVGADDGLSAGLVNISETPVDGWDLVYVGCVYNAYDHALDLNNQSEASEPRYTAYSGIDIELSLGDDVSCYFFNEERASIEVTKYWDVNQNGIRDEGEVTLPEWTFNLQACDYQYDMYQSQERVTSQNYDDYCESYEMMNVDAMGMVYPPTLIDMEQTTGENGMLLFEDLKPYRSYRLSEVQKEGWNLSRISCTYPDYYEVSELSYEINSKMIYPFAGEKVVCEVGNYQDARLEIVKTNDRIGDDLLPGDVVNYQIVVNNPVDSGIAYESVVYDLLPEGVTYVAGSSSVYSSVRGLVDSALGSDDYADNTPASWTIGDMQPGEVVTIAYSATINSDASAGIYQNIAFVKAMACMVNPIDLTDVFSPTMDDEEFKLDISDSAQMVQIDDEMIVSPCPQNIGCSVPYAMMPLENLNSNNYFATGCPDYVSILGNQLDGVGDPFVYSPVKVIEIEEAQGFVLGIQTLVNTGTPAILPPLVGLSVAATALALSGAKRRSKLNIGFLKSFASSAKYLIAALMITAIFGTANVSAATGDGWQLSVVDLESATSSNSLNISYQVLSTDFEDSFEVSLYQDGELVETASINTPLGGSGKFEVASLDDGEYQFIVAATNSNDPMTKQSTQSVIIDSQSPASPTYNGVSRDGRNYTLRFKLAQDSDATSVRIYASTDKEFDADESTLIAEISPTPGVDQVYEYNSSSDQQLYFAVEAVDAAGNKSAIVGDEQTVIDNSVVQLEADSNFDDGLEASDSSSDDQSEIGSTSEDQSEVLGEDSDSDTTVDAQESGSNTVRYLVIGGLVAAVAWFIWNQRSAKED